MSWNDKTINRLKALWDEGLSCSRIALMLNAEFGARFTRNSVIGKVHRKGWAVRKQQAPRRAALGPSRYARKLPPTPLPDEPPPCEPDALVLKSGAHVTIATIGHKQCRWPYGDPQEPTFHLCGHPTITLSPYCAAHARKAFAPGYVRARKDEAGEELSEIYRRERVFA